jgi:hypothetical protein
MQNERKMLAVGNCRLLKRLKKTRQQKNETNQPASRKYA